MSEQKTSYMQELDHWIQTEIVQPLHFGPPPTDDLSAPSWDDIVNEVHRAIRMRVLESYHNGQAAGPAKPRGAFKPRQR